MLRLLITFCYLCYCTILPAQGWWSLIDVPDDNAGEFIFPQTDGSTVMVGRANADFFLARFSAAGEVDTYWKETLPTFSNQLVSAVQLPDSTLAVIARGYITPGNVPFSTLYRYTPGLDLLDTTQYFNASIFRLAAHPPNLAAWVILPFSDVQLWLIDAAGDVVDTLALPNSQSAAPDIIPTPDGGLNMLWTSVDFTSNPQTYTLQLTHYNAALEQTWSYEPGITDTIPPFLTSLAVDEAGTAIGTALYYPWLSNNSLDLDTLQYVFTVDAQGNERWKRLYTDELNLIITDVAPTPSGQLVVSGPANDTSMASLAGLDSLGNLLWHHIYLFPPIYNSTFFDVGVFPDGNLVAGGWALLPGTLYRGYLVKTLPDGGLSALHDGILTPERIDITPNPVTDRAEIRWLGAAPSGWTFTLYDTGGCMVEQRQVDGDRFTFFPRRLPAGRYFAEARAAGRGSAWRQLIIAR